MINLLSSYYKRSIRRELRIRAVSSWLILCSVILVFLSIVSFPAYFLQKTKKDLIEKENTITTEDTESLSAEALLSDVSEINTKVSEMIMILSPSGVYPDMVKVALHPDTNNIKISEIYLGKNDNKLFIKISGVADSREALLQYSTSLKQGDLCEDFSAPVSSLYKSEEIDFIIDCNIKEKPE
jgi:hypothetical protein